MSVSQERMLTVKKLEKVRRAKMRVKKEQDEDFETYLATQGSKWHEKKE